jgi:hypothetical protein
MGRMALQLLAWQVWRGPSLWDWVARHGRSRKVWLFFRWKARQEWFGESRIGQVRSGRQRSDGQGLHGSQWHGRRVYARHSAIRRALASQARHLTQMQGGYRTAGSASSCMVCTGMAGMALNGWTRHCRLRRDRSPRPRSAGSAVQLKTRQHTARQATQRSTGTPCHGRHPTTRNTRHRRQARCGLFGRQATAGPVSMARQCVEGAAGTLRQEWPCEVAPDTAGAFTTKRQHNGALRGPFHPRENHDHFSIPRRSDPHRTGARR